VDGNPQQDPSWYSGYGHGSNPYDSGVHDRPYRLPDQRDGGYAAPAPYATPDPVSSTGSHARPTSSVRGPEYPAVRPANATSLADAPAPGRYAAEGTPTKAVSRDVAYRTRRPISSFLVAAVTLVLMIPAIMLLIRETFGDGPVAPGGIVPAVLLVLGLPLTGLGLFSLAGAGQLTVQAWLRPPLAYLPIGLLILIAAGLGAG
jgi:hypothetical protein